MTHPTSIHTTTPFELMQVGDGVYAAIIKPGTGAMGNAGIVDLGGEVLIFDTFFTPQAGAELRQVAEELCQSPVRYVVNSHFHMDHVGGNQVFRDATIISTETTRQLIHSRSQQMVAYIGANPEYLEMVAQALEMEQEAGKRAELAEMLGDMQAFVAAFPTFQVTLPHLTFERSMTLHGTKRSVTLLQKGNGHTTCDSVLYLPSEQILFTGDLLTVGTHPNIKDGNPFEWLRILADLQQFAVRTTVPGHGSVAKREELGVVQRYLQELIETATELVNNGVPLEDVAESTIPEAYCDWNGGSLYGANLQTLCQMMGGQE